MASASFSRKGAEGLVAACQPSSWICVSCVGCDEYEDLQTVPSLKTSVVDEAWTIANRVIRHHDFSFYLRLVTLAGEEVTDERRRCVGLVCTHWDQSFNKLWESIYFKTGGRVRQVVLGIRSIDENSKRLARWSQFLSSHEARLCTQDAPYHMPVVMRNWW